LQGRPDRFLLLARPPGENALQRRALLALSLCAPALARAQNLGERPVRLIVPCSTGGVANMEARFLQQRVSENLGLPFIV